MSLTEFLSEREVGIGAEFTHTSMIGGKWNILEDDMEKFFKLYSKAVTNTELYMTEKHVADFGPIVIDFDFKFETMIKPRPIDKSVMDSVVQHLKEILEEMFGDANDYTCVVLQRPCRYKKKEEYTDGLHIQFPFIVCEYVCQFALRQKFMTTYKFDIECANDMNTIYDSAVILRNNWCMYMSTKKGLKPYEIVEIYYSDLELDNMSTVQRVKLLSIRNKSTDMRIKPVNFDIIDEYFATVNKNKPRQPNVKQVVDVKPLEITKDQTYNEKTIRSLLNMLKQDRVDIYKKWIKIGRILHHCKMSDKDNDIDYDNIWHEWSKKSNKYSKKSCTYQWGYFDRLKWNPYTIGSLYYYARKDDPVEYANYHIKAYMMKQKDQIPIKKFKMGSVIKKEYGTIVELDTKKYCPFIKNDHDHNSVYLMVTQNGWCIKCSDCKYEQIPNNDLFQIPNQTLFYIFGMKNVYDDITINNDYNSENATEMSPFYQSEYNVFDDKKLNDLVYASLNCTGSNIAELVYYLYKDKFNCTAGKEWYEYHEHKWTIGDHVIFKLISTDVVKYHTQLIKYYRGIKTKDPVLREHILTMIDVMKKLIGKLQATTFKDGIMKDICYTFYLNNKNFVDELDQKHHLLGFQNGVYDLEKFEFRDGRPDDYISMSTGYDYVNEYSKNKKALFQFLEDIQPLPAQRDYLLKYTATGLSGHNNEEIAVCLSGKTRNGKTKYKDLVDFTLGDYFITFASNLLTMPRPAPSNPQPELIAFKNKRFGLGSEPETKNGKTGQINTSFFKFLTGNEKIPCRNLYDKTITMFNPTHKIGLLCNKIPAMDDNDDDAVWERLRCIEFPIKFVDNPTKENERKINKNLKQILPSWKQDFMLLLIEKYREYKITGLVATDEILKFTRSYKDENDIYKHFLDEMTVKSDKHIHTSVLYSAFKEWYIRNNPKTKIPSNKIFVEGLRCHVTVENVKIDGKSTTGTKNLQIVWGINQDEPDELDFIDDE